MPQKPPAFFRKNGNVRFHRSRHLEKDLSEPSRRHPAGSPPEHAPPDVAKAKGSVGKSPSMCWGEAIVKPGRQKGLLMEKGEYEDCPTVPETLKTYPDFYASSTPHYHPRSGSDQLFHSAGWMPPSSRSVPPFYFPEYGPRISGRNPETCGWRQSLYTPVKPGRTILMRRNPCPDEHQDRWIRRIS